MSWSQSTGLPELILEEKSHNSTRGGRRGSAQLWLGCVGGGSFREREQALQSSLEVVARPPWTTSLSYGLRPEAWAVAPPPSTLRDSIQPAVMIQSNLQADSPDMGSSKSWRVSAGIGWGNSPPGCSSQTPAAQHCPQPSLSCNLSLDLQFQLRCRGGRSDRKFQGLLQGHSPPFTPPPPPPPPLYSNPQFPMKQKF